jgi:hypothetical protein
MCLTTLSCVYSRCARRPVACCHTLHPCLLCAALFLAALLPSCHVQAARPRQRQQAVMLPSPPSVCLLLAPASSTWWQQAAAHALRSWAQHWATAGARHVYRSRPSVYYHTIKYMGLPFVTVMETCCWRWATDCLKPLRKAPQCWNMDSQFGTGKT